jgi:putative DNA primase/helicase
MARVAQKAQRKAFPLTEAGDAEHFADLFGDRVRYDHRRGRWLIFSGHRWVPEDDGALHRLALNAIRQRQGDALALDDRSDREQLIKWAIDGESRRRIENMLALSKSVLPISDAGDSWDLNPWLLGVTNGVVDLQTGILRAGRPDDRITMATRVAFSSTGTAPRWEQTIREIFKDDEEMIRYVHRALGYSVTGDCREECLFMNYGDGANGKGTLINTVRWVLGEYADNLSFSALEQHDRKGGSASPELAKLPGKRFVTASESSDAVRLDEGRIKTLTGRDALTARSLYGNEFTFEPNAKFWLSTNHKPRVGDDSEGFWRRMHLLPYLQSFIDREDRKLKDALRAEAAGILRWLVQGCRLWQDHGLNPPTIVRAATADYRRESELLTPFFDACCEVVGGAKVKALDLYEAYQRWCGASDINSPLNQTTFGLQVRKRFRAEKKRGVVYFGLRLCTT